MSTHALDEGTKNTLEHFVERTEALAQFVSENRFGGGLAGIFRNVNEGEWQIHSAINGSLCILRSFLQSQDGITLFSVEEARRPQQVESQGPQFLQTLPDPLSQLGQLPPLKRPNLFDLNVSAKWRETVYHAYDQIYLFLAIVPDNLTYNGQMITRFEVLDTFLYGKFVHLTAEKRKKYNQWKSEPELFDKLKEVFVFSLGFIAGQIMEVAKASIHELDLHTRNTESYSGEG
jgi:hypothetical protein